MKKNLIYQHWVPLGKGFEPDYVRYSSDNFREYADIHNVEYMFENKRYFKHVSPFLDNVMINRLRNYYEIMRLFYDKKFDDYDDILYTDVDILIKNFDDNIFDIKFVNIGMCVEPFLSDEYQQTHYNSGVVLFSKDFRKKARGMFSDWEEWIVKEKTKHFPNGIPDGSEMVELGDEFYINQKIRDYNIQVTDLPSKWNVQEVHRNVFEHKNFMHFTNSTKKKIPNEYFKNKLKGVR